MKSLNWLDLAFVIFYNTIMNPVTFAMNTPNLILRPYRVEDWARVHLYGAIPEFSQYEAWGPNTEQDTKDFISIMMQQSMQKDRYNFDFAICLKESDLLIGGCGIRREAQLSKVANMGWAINPDFQGKGYATEAATSLLQFGFDDLNLKLIYATCDSRNIASFMVMEKLGMQRVGLLVGERKQKGYLRDTLRYEIETTR